MINKTSDFLFSIRKIIMGEDFEGQDNLLKACKRYRISEENSKKFVMVQQELLEKINSTPSSEPKETHEVFFPQLILSKLYELNNEFVGILPFEYNLSAAALTRQVIEVYILTTYCRAYPSFKEKILKDKNEKFADKKRRIKDLETQIDFPYIPTLNKRTFLNGLYNDFTFFSSVFHPSAMSLSKNIWIQNNKGKNTTTYYQTPQIEEGEIIILFKKAPPLQGEMEFIIGNFYIYTYFVLKELELLEKK